MEVAHCGKGKKIARNAMLTVRFGVTEWMAWSERDRQRNGREKRSGPGDDA